MSKTRIKELRILLRKYFGISDPKPIETKKPIPEKAATQPEKVSSLIEEIGKDIFGIRVKVEWGKCPHCDTTTQLLSLYSNYFRCSLCQETIRQYVNGHIAYLPVDNKTLDEKNDGA
tara:strand:- start:438 stop:788 length:351 start_codon:yes stop_codon:yes gene_type:complete